MDNLVRNLAIGAGALVALAGSYVAGSATDGVDTLLANKIKVNREPVAVIEKLDLDQTTLYSVGSDLCGLNADGELKVAKPVTEWETVLVQKGNDNYGSETTVTYTSNDCPLGN